MGYQNCCVKYYCDVYEQADPNSVILGHYYANDQITLYEGSSNHYIRTTWNGSLAYVERSKVSTADSACCPDRNATNMFGTSTLQYEYPAPERAKVYNLQWTLKRLGYNPGTVDGKFGQGTDSAVRQFQTDENLTVDGKVGATTRQTLINVLDAG